MSMDNSPSFFATLRNAAGSMGQAVQATAALVATTAEAGEGYAKALKINGETVAHISMNHQKRSQVIQDIKLAEVMGEAQEEFGEKYADLFAKPDLADPD